MQSSTAQPNVHVMTCEVHAPLEQPVSKNSRLESRHRRSLQRRDDDVLPQPFNGSQVPDSVTSTTPWPKVTHCDAKKVQSVLATCVPQLSVAVLQVGVKTL